MNCHGPQRDLFTAKFVYVYRVVYAQAMKIIFKLIYVRNMQIFKHIFRYAKLFTIYV